MERRKNKNRKEKCAFFFNLNFEDVIVLDIELQVKRELLCVIFNYHLCFCLENQMEWRHFNCNADLGFSFMIASCIIQVIIIISDILVITFLRIWNNRWLTFEVLKHQPILNGIIFLSQNSFKDYKLPLSTKETTLLHGHKFHNYCSNYIYKIATTFKQ